MLILGMDYERLAQILLKTVLTLNIRVQAQNEKISPTTFPKRFDPSIDLAPIFWPPETVFTYHQGLLCGPSGPPYVNPPVWTVLASTSEILLRIGIFG